MRRRSILWTHDCTAMYGAVRNSVQLLGGVEFILMLQSTIFMECRRSSIRDKKAQVLRDSVGERFHAPSVIRCWIRSDRAIRRT